MLKEGEELIALEMHMRGQRYSLLRHIPTLQQLNHQRIHFRSISIIPLSLEQAIDDVMLP